MEASLLIALLSGLIGAAILTILIYLLPFFGYQLDIPYLIGSRFVDLKQKTRLYFVGITLHLIIGGAWGVLYVFLISAMAATPNWATGLLWGFGHGIFVGSMMGILADSHPKMGKGNPIDHPGILGRRWGAAMPYFILGLHIIYGISAMAIYHSMVTS